MIMRGVMIWAGVALISALSWILYVFGVFLIYTGIKMVFVDTEVHPENNQVLKLARRLFLISPQFEGQKFVTRWQGKRALTPLALVLLMVETTDLIFAVDSIPAIFGVTSKPFIVFTSNVFAILGLRSLYFVLAGAIGYFRYLKVGLALVLVFVGIKMLIAPHGEHGNRFQYEIPIGASLLMVVGIIVCSILASIIAARMESKAERPPK